MITSRKAFTLIELLVVVAIIAILAAIAVPNFLEAQVRSKVTAAKADMATLRTGLEAYAVDNNSYPDAVLVQPHMRLRRLTTPIAYLTSVPTDPFRRTATGTDGPGGQGGGYQYSAMGPENPERWALISNGPDRQRDCTRDEFNFYPGYSGGLFFGQVVGFESYLLYDPTNGTVSRGDVFRASDYNPG